MSNRATILYIDDEPDNLMAFKVIFRRQYRVFVAESAAAALQIIGQEKIDLVLSDYKMPKTTGVELLQIVQKNHPDVARLIVTGFGDIDIIRSAMKKGIVEQMINKPWDVEELKEIFSTTLQ
ncbi:MAG: response regulator [Bacteroidota bacterium]